MSKQTVDGQGTKRKRAPHAGIDGIECNEAERQRRVIEARKKMMERKRAASTNTESAVARATMAARVSSKSRSDPKLPIMSASNQVDAEAAGFIRTTIKNILREWKKQLPSISSSCRPAAAKEAEKKFRQCKTDIQPLLRMCKQKCVPKAMLNHIHKITKSIDSREYKQAHDEYMLLAIGNAPWPMGVTAVGIHARRGRENIQEGKIAHAMDDEQTRKICASLKRILTYCQTRDKAVTPSEKVCL